MSQRHSVYSVNILFLIVLALQLLNFFFLGIPQYPRLILNEAFFVLLPSLLYLRWAGLPLRNTVKLRNPGWKTGLASFLIGAGLYPVSIVSAAIFQLLLGYQMAGVDGILPQTTWEGVLAIIAYAVMAPLCEEVFARGIIQRTYQDHLGPRKGIIWGGVLFIVFHLSLLQGLTIIPLSLALGYVYWRTNSLIASILTHFGANAMAAMVVTSNVFWKNATSILVSPVSLVIGVLLAVLGFRLLKNNTKVAAPQEKASPERSKGFKKAWPLLLAGLLYLVVIGYEFTTSRFPEVFHDPIKIEATQLQESSEWKYAIHNAAGEPVADVTCLLEPEGDIAFLFWKSAHQAYDVQVRGGRFMGSDLTKEEELSFRQSDGQPLHGKLISHFEHESTETEWSFDGQRFVVHVGTSRQPEEVFEIVFDGHKNRVVLERSSWPWVLRSLPFASGYSGTAYYFAPYTWRQATQDNGPVLEQVVVTVTGPESLETPGGTWQAWKVTLGQKEVAWYSVDAPHILLKYDNGFETMVLSGH
jgi:membrane protease YdiL (CAAX protease family)